MAAHPSVACPKCNAMNAPGQAHILKVADERGVHYECKPCSHFFYATEHA